MMHYIAIIVYFPHQYELNKVAETRLGDTEEIPVAR